MGRELTPHRIAPLTSLSCDIVVSCGISTCFQVLSPCMGQIVHALLTRPPLESYLPYRSTSGKIPVRLACVKHAASVRPEPGSNSDVQSSSLPQVPLKSSPKLFSFPSDTAFYSQNTDCSFFALSLSLYRFQGSRPAPLFSVFPRQHGLL